MLGKGGPTTSHISGRPAIPATLPPTAPRAEDENPVSLSRIEEKWRNNLRSWYPKCLNTRENGSKELRKKTLMRQSINVL